MADWELPLFQDGPNKDNPPSERYKKALNHLLDFWLDTLDDGEREEYSDFIDTCNNLRDIVKSTWFDPDAWEERRQLLRPSLLPKGSTNRLRDHIRVRLREVYRAFVFGQNMSCVALCRTLVEFILNQNAIKLGVGITTKSQWERTLSQIIEEIKNRNPTIACHAESVRNHGSRVIHPKKHSVVAIPRIIQSEALTCFNDTVAIIEQLYGKDG